MSGPRPVPVHVAERYDFGWEGRQRQKWQSRSAAAASPSRAQDVHRLLVPTFAFPGCPHDGIKGETTDAASLTSQAVGGDIHAVDHQRLSNTLWNKFEG